ARAYDLSRNGDPTNPLATGANTSVVSIRLTGPRLFIVTSSKMHQYNLTDPTDNYEAALQRDFALPRVRGMMLGKDHAIVIDDPVDRGPAGSPVVRLVAIN